MCVSFIRKSAVFEFAQMYVPPETNHFFHMKNFGLAVENWKRATLLK